MNAENRLTRSMLMRMGKKQATAVMDDCGLTEDEKQNRELTMCWSAIKNMKKATHTDMPAAKMKMPEPGNPY